MSYRKTVGPFNSIIGVLLLVAFFVGIFFILKGLFWVLTWVAPVLLIAALIIDKSVVVNYGLWIWKTLKNKPLLGIAAIIFTVIGYMVVFPFLFAKAIFKKKIKDVTREIEKEREGELIDFEEITSKPQKENRTELPKLEKTERKSEYDRLFE